jgi:hypothetical protein
MGTLLLSGAALAELEVKPYGDAQFRLRGAYHTLSNDDDSQSALEYSNRISWRTGVRAKVDDQLSLQFQIGNPYNAADNVNYQRNGIGSIGVHLAYGTWNPGSFFITAGIVPVNSHGPLDLLENSLNGTTIGNFGAASHNGWATRTDNSLTGIRIGAPIVKGDVKVGAELFTSVTTFREHTIDNTDLSVEPKDNPSATLFVLDIPISSGALRVTPQVAMVMNRLYNSAEEKGDHEMAFGTSASYRVNPQLSLNLTGAYAMGSNDNTEATTTRDMSGIFVGVGGSYRTGPGQIQLEYKMNTVENDKADKSGITYHYIDARYAIGVHSKFSITPRFRVYLTQPEADGAINTTELRPELIFTASF